MDLIIFVYTLIGLLLVIMAIPFMRDRVGPNNWAGFRIPETTEDPEVWYPAHHYAGKWMFGLGWVNIIAAIGLALLPGMGETLYVTLMTVVLLGGLGVGLLFSWRYARGITKEPTDKTEY